MLRRVIEDNPSGFNEQIDRTAEVPPPNAGVRRMKEVSWHDALVRTDNLLTAHGIFKKS